MPRDMVSRVSCKKRWMSRVPNHKYDVVAVDCGIKYNIIRSLNRVGCNVTVVPYNTAAEEIDGHCSPDGVVLVERPRQPGGRDAGDRTGEGSCGASCPIFGICLGHQMICAGLRRQDLSR